MATAVAFQARRRKRLDLAEAWLADIPSPTALTGVREQGEAAVLELRGDRAGALRILERVETSIEGQAGYPGRDLTLRLLRRWKSELEA